MIAQDFFRPRRYLVLDDHSPNLLVIDGARGLAAAAAVGSGAIATHKGRE
jgi:hypothetical protein